MLDDIGYDVDPSYVGGVMEIFGQFDSDGGGTIDMGEFPALWEHLGGAALDAETEVAEAPAAGVGGRPPRRLHFGAPASAHRGIPRHLLA